GVRVAVVALLAVVDHAVPAAREATGRAAGVGRRIGVVGAVVAFLAGDAQHPVAAGSIADALRRGPVFEAGEARLDLAARAAPVTVVAVAVVAFLAFAAEAVAAGEHAGTVGAEPREPLLAAAEVVVREAVDADLVF